MISFAVTAFNEMSTEQEHGQRILQCIRAPQQHEAIGEIVIVDDGSEDYPELAALLADEPKVHLYHNEENRGVFVNKIEAVARASNTWVITCDSDNQMDDQFFDLILSLNLCPDTWYCPSFAKPEFDYRHLAGKYTLSTLQDILEQPRADCFLNTGNQTVCRPRFMRVFGKYRGQRADKIMAWPLKARAEREGSARDLHWRLVFDALDSFLLNLEWLIPGGSLHIVSGLEYAHHYSGGADSNYARSPREKEELADQLMLCTKALTVFAKATRG